LEILLWDKYCEKIKLEKVLGLDKKTMNYIERFFIGVKSMVKGAEGIVEKINRVVQGGFLYDEYC